MLELNVDKAMADLLWDASTSRQPAVLTMFHDGQVIQFRLGFRSTEVITHGPTEWRYGKECTVRLKLVQLEEAVIVENSAPERDTSLRDAVRANP
jgi:hypothetical protein